MKHAGPQALQSLSALLGKLRKRAALVEKTPGSFYFRSRGFLHFHEDAAGMFADLKLNLQTFSRFRVSTLAEQAKLLARVDRCLRLGAVSKKSK